MWFPMRHVTTGAFLALCIGLFCIAPGFAQDTRNSGDLLVSEGPTPKRITVIVNKSRTINVGKPFARAMVGSVDYADVVPLSDRCAPRTRRVSFRNPSNVVASPSSTKL